MRAEMRPQGLARRPSFQNNCGKQLDGEKGQVGCIKEVAYHKDCYGRLRFGVLEMKRWTFLHALGW
jgi:hypothetical protein